MTDTRFVEHDAMGFRFVTANVESRFVEDVIAESKDSSGHDHKGKGEGGGQFTGQGGNGAKDPAKSGAKGKATAISDEQRDALRELHRLFPDGVAHLLSDTGHVHRDHLENDDERHARVGMAAHRVGFQNAAAQIEAMHTANEHTSRVVGEDTAINESLNALPNSSEFATARDVYAGYEGGEAVEDALGEIADALGEIEESTVPGYPDRPDVEDYRTDESGLPDETDPAVFDGWDASDVEQQAKDAREAHEGRAADFADESRTYQTEVKETSQAFREEQSGYLHTVKAACHTALAIPEADWEDDGVRAQVQSLAAGVEAILNRLAKGVVKPASASESLESLARSVLAESVAGEHYGITDGRAWVSEAVYARLDEAGRAGLTKKQVRDKNGNLVYRWVRTGTAQGSENEPAPSGAEQAIAAAFKNPKALTADEVKTLSAHLTGIPRERLRQLALAASHRIGPTKAAIAKRLLEHVRKQQAATKPANAHDARREQFLTAKPNPGESPHAFALRHYPELAAVPGLHVEGADGPMARQSVHDLYLMGGVAKQLGDAGVTVYISDKPMTQTDQMQHMAGHSPRGWHAGATWDTVAGCYDPFHSKTIAGTGASGAASLLAHEHGHAIGDVFRLNNDDETIQFHAQLYPKLSLYERQDGPGGFAGRQEMIAESIAIRVRGGRSEVARAYSPEYADWLERKLNQHGGFRNAGEKTP